MPWASESKLHTKEEKMRIVIALLTVFLLFGCTTDPIIIQAKPIERIPLVLPDVDGYEAYEIKWIVITEANAKEKFAKLKRKGIPVAIIGVTGDGYKILGLANGDKRKLIRQLQAQIKAYKQYYIAVEDRDEEHNKEVTESNTPK